MKEALMLPNWSLPVWMAVACVGFFVTYLPTIIGRNKRNCRAILALNFFLGWTLIGWVVALVWACMEDDEEDSARARPLSLSALFFAHLVLTAVTGLVCYSIANAALAEIAKQEQERSAALAATAAANAQAERRREDAEQARLRQPAQDAFDALPKWDILARPINREPPPGLQPTAALPPPPYVKAPPRTPDPRAVAAEIAKKYGAPR